MDPLLHGHDPETGIVAVQQAGDSRVKLYVRSGASVSAREAEFFPFFFLTDASFLKGFPERHWVGELGGNNFYRYICAFTGWHDMWEAIHFIIDNYNRQHETKIESYTDAGLLHIRADPVSQFLMQSGKTLFKGMIFDDLYRLQLDIETYSPKGFRFRNPNRQDDRVILAALSDNRGWRFDINGKGKSERDILEELANTIKEKDPDVVEGHGILNFDLPYILKRCEILGIDFAVGRDGTVPHSFDPRSATGDRAPDYPLFEIAGRHVVDTLHLVQSYDATKRTLDNYSLAYVAQYLGFAKPDRTHLTADRIPWCWHNEPDTLIKYAVDNVDETKRLSEYLSPSTFYLSQMVPSNYGSLARLGSAAKIESILLREYVRQKHSVPKPQAGSQSTGGYTAIFYTGVLGPILHVDVESLYPSIMISEKIRPTSDGLGVFEHVLTQLTSIRIDAKKKMVSSEDPSEKAKLDALQASYKILINSFYGYLGYSQGLFNDYAAADRVTRAGHKVLARLIEEISNTGGKVIEVDTDGVFFVPPNSVRTRSDEDDLVAILSSTLPNGIRITVDGRCKRMLSYKKKNYALLGYDNKISIKGSSLMSRSMEKFGRYFINKCIEGLLIGNVDDIHRVYESLHNSISQHRLPVNDFARAETLKDSTERYTKEVDSGKRNRTASYEVAIASNLHSKPGDKVFYYITGTGAGVKGFENCKSADDWDPNFPDENIPYYLKRLDEFAKKFEIFLSQEDFHAVFSVEGLFSFSPESIRVLTLPAGEMASEATGDEEEKFDIDPKIWLDEG